LNPEDGPPAGDALQLLLFPFLDALARTPIAHAMRDSVWLYPAVELIHIVGFVMLVGAAAMFDLRLLGASRNVPVSALAAHLLPWARLGFFILIPTGFLLFTSDPTTNAANPAFRIKMAVILIGLLNVAAFHWGIFRSVRSWDTLITAPFAARLAALVSLLAWFAALAAGRLMAYTGSAGLG
jgi:hypothetical protein